MPLTLFNDLTREKELFEPLEPGKVKFYSCGPTVYDYFHIGNARPFIVFDSLRRYMEASGYEVIYVQNFTDIDDKMITRAAQLGISVPELAGRFVDAYYEDADALGIKRPSFSPMATAFIPEIVALVVRLIERGHAYVAGGDVYFEVASFPGYGKLAKQSLDDLLSGARIEIDERKRHPLDFALWKAKKDGEPFWQSPWGEGRPGWHIECSAMSMKILGETIDIHAGGSDLVFPHHENEIAQAEAATEKPFVRYWIHNGYILIDQEKMSKSLGNFFTAREARKRFSSVAIRLFMLGAHYRSPISFSDDSLKQAESGVTRIKNCIADLSSAPSDASLPLNSEGESFLDNSVSRFNASLDDDFNTAGAIGVLFETVKMINLSVSNGMSLNPVFRQKAMDFLSYADSILGVIGLADAIEDPSAPDEEIDNLISAREEARKKRNFARADTIRHELASRGIVLEDTPLGTRWKKI
ncbi:MAG: cysteine--tRNA ligase [Thermovirgaceae bacterium]|nr:cysteine--tRNA ligase [Thermovirgaceae bacterium]